MSYQEIQIPVPWGIIAAKTWGNNKDPLVLAIHGWADNANSFDPLIPLLPDCLYYVCIDLPGHGMSSPVESSLILRDIDNIIAIKFVYDYFKRKKITIIGHSLGGMLALLFTQLYSTYVSKIIIFDIIYFYPRPPDVHLRHLLFFYNQRIKFLKKENESPAYTKEEIFERMMSKRLTSLSEKAAKVLIERSIEPAEDGKYKLKLAQNSKQMILTNFTIENSLQILKTLPIKCPHVIIMSSSSSFLKIVFKKVLNVFMQNPNFEFHIVDGTHEVHIDNAEQVAEIVSKFLIKYRNKL